MPMVNIVSGGAHAGRALDIQDVLVVPVAARSFAEAIEWVWRARSACAQLLDASGGSSALVADEGGLAGSLATNEAALALVTDGIARAGFVPGEQVALAVDVAANQNLRRHFLPAGPGRPRLRLSAAGWQSWPVGVSGTRSSHWKTCWPRTTGPVGEPPGTSSATAANWWVTTCSPPGSSGCGGE